MAAPATRPDSSRTDQPRLVCRIRRRQLRRGSSPTAGEIELQNVSPDVVEIVLHSSPLQYLNLIVTDSTGTVVSDSFYGDLFSPLEEAYVLRLQPGETLTRPVSLVGNVSKAKQLPGRYTVRAVYEYEDLKAVSESFDVQLPGVDASQLPAS